MPRCANCGVVDWLGQKAQKVSRYDEGGEASLGYGNKSVRVLIRVRSEKIRVDHIRVRIVR